MANILGVNDNVQGQLAAGISDSELSIVLDTGDGARFPTIKTGAATSGGSGTVLNSTGIGSKVSVGDIIENITDDSVARVLTVTTNSITTTPLFGGSDDTWQNSDEWRVDRFDITINRKDSSGAITEYEKVRISDHALSSNTLTVAKVGDRGLGDTSATAWTSDLANVYVELFTLSIHITSLKALISQNMEDIANRYTKTEIHALLDARNWKQSCVVATTENISLASDLEAGDTIDDVVLNEGDRVLVKDQTSASENGIYVVPASGAASRADDMSESTEFTAAVVAIEQGTQNADTMWLCQADDPTVETDDIDFVAFTPTEVASEAEAVAKTSINNSKIMTPLRVDQAIKAKRLSAGDDSDGAIDGSSNVTITGSNNTLIVKNYTTLAAAQGGGKTFSITPTGCVTILKFSGDADFTDWTFDWSGKGMPGSAGGTGGAAITSGGAVTGNDGTNPAAIGSLTSFQEPNQLGNITNATKGTGQAAATSAGGGAGGASNASILGDGNNGSGGGGTGGGTAGNAGTNAYPWDDISHLLPKYRLEHLIGGGGGGGGGGASGGLGTGGGTSGKGGDGGAGGAGGGVLIIMVGGDVIFSSSTFDCSGIDGVNGENGANEGGGFAAGGAGGGGGAGGSGGVFYLLYAGSATGSPTVDVSGGAAGTGGTGGLGGGGGANGGAGGAGGAGRNGLSVVSQNIWFA